MDEPQPSRLLPRSETRFPSYPCLAIGSASRSPCHDARRTPSNQVHIWLDPHSGSGHSQLPGPVVSRIPKALLQHRARLVKKELPRPDRETRTEPETEMCSSLGRTRRAIRSIHSTDGPPGMTDRPSTILGCSAAGIVMLAQVSPLAAS